MLTLINMLVQFLIIVKQRLNAKVRTIINHFGQMTLPGALTARRFRSNSSTSAESEWSAWLSPCLEVRRALVLMARPRWARVLMLPYWPEGPWCWILVGRYALRIVFAFVTARWVFQCRWGDDFFAEKERTDYTWYAFMMCTMRGSARLFFIANLEVIGRATVTLAPSWSPLILQIRLNQLLIWGLIVWLLFRFWFWSRFYPRLSSSFWQIGFTLRWLVTQVWIFSFLTKFLIHDVPLPG